MTGRLPEARCRFNLPSTRGNANSANAPTAVAAAAAAGPGVAHGGGDNKGASAAAGAGGSVLDFGRASVGVEVVRTVMLQNTGKSPAVFFVDVADLKLVRSVSTPGGCLKEGVRCTYLYALRNACIAPGVGAVWTRRRAREAALYRDESF